MRVKCRFCKASIEKADAFKDPDKNFYYCSEEHYAAAVKKKENEVKEKEKSAAEKSEYDAIFEQTKKIFGYEFQGYALLKREVKNWEKLANRKKILSYIQENEKFLSDAISHKNFESDFHRVRYYSVIISSKLHDYKETSRKDMGISVQPLNEVTYETKYKSKARVSLEDLEEE